MLCARPRTADIDAAAGALEEVRRIVEQLRRSWPDVEIVLRADGGFCRDELLIWCEANGVDYVIGLPKNARLRRCIKRRMKLARRRFVKTGEAARAFGDFRYRTRKSWTRRRRVVGKAEYLAKRENPRFVVTSLRAEQAAAQHLYETIYCARGEMENRIKEQQMGLFADRTSTASFGSNQIRLYFSSIGYCVIEALRRLGLAGTKMARAQCTTIRPRLLKIGARMRITARKVWISLASGYAWAGVFEQVYENLERGEPRSS